TSTSVRSSVRATTRPPRNGCGRATSNSPAPPTISSRPVPHRPPSRRPCCCAARGGICRRTRRTSPPPTTTRARTGAPACTRTWSPQAGRTRRGGRSRRRTPRPSPMPRGWPSRCGARTSSACSIGWPATLWSPSTHGTTPPPPVPRRRSSSRGGGVRSVPPPRRRPCSPSTSARHLLRSARCEMELRRPELSPRERAPRESPAPRLRAVAASLLARGDRLHDRGYRWLTSGPRSLYGLAMTRILLGVVGLGVLLTNFGGRHYSFGTASSWNGELAEPTSDFPRIWLFSAFRATAESPALFTALYLSAIVAALMVTVGLVTRPAIAVHLVLWVSLIETNDSLSDQSDNAYRIFLVLLLLTRCADRW